MPVLQGNLVDGKVEEKIEIVFILLVLKRVLKGFCRYSIQYTDVQMKITGFDYARIFY